MQICELFNQQMVVRFLFNPPNSHTDIISPVFVKVWLYFCFFFQPPNTEQHSQRAARAVKRMASTARPKVQPYILFNLHQRQPNMFHLSANLVCCELCSLKSQIFSGSTQRLTSQCKPLLLNHLSPSFACRRHGGRKKSNRRTPNNLKARTSVCSRWVI